MAPVRIRVGCFRQDLTRCPDRTLHRTWTRYVLQNRWDELTLPARRIQPRVWRISGIRRKTDEGTANAPPSTADFSLSLLYTCKIAKPLFYKQALKYQLLFCMHKKKQPLLMSENILVPLEPLTKRRICQMIPAYFNTTYYHKCFMNIGSAFVTHSQPAILIKPSQCTFNHPTVNTKTTAIFGSSPSQYGFNPFCSQLLTMGLRNPTRLSDLI